MLKKIAPILLSLAFGLWAADFWTTKPFTEWTDKDAQRMETNSPWSRPLSVPTGEGGGGGGGTGKGGRSKGGGGGGGGDDSVMSSPGGGRGIQEVGGGGLGGGSSIMLTVSWRTALPVRQAVAKAKYGDEAATSPEAKKLIEEDQKYYAILLTGIPGRSVRNGDKMKELLLQNTTLTVKGKDPIQASDVQSGGNEQKALVLFLFPKTAPLSVDDKDVEFATKLGPLVVRQKFHLKDMVFNGKLEL
jgi:hypothetical protein